MATFQASRFTEGNHVFPDKISIDASGVTVCSPRLFDGRESFIPFDEIAQVNIESHVIGYDSVSLRTSGRSGVCVHGFTKREVGEICSMIQHGIDLCNGRFNTSTEDRRGDDEGDMEMLMEEFDEERESWKRERKALETQQQQLAEELAAVRELQRAQGRQSAADGTIDTVKEGATQAVNLVGGGRRAEPVLHENEPEVVDASFVVGAEADAEDAGVSFIWTFDKCVGPHGGVIRTASVSSWDKYIVESVGVQRLLLEVRSHPEFGDSLIVSVKKGVIDVAAGARLRFGRKRPRLYALVEAQDDSTTYAFIDIDFREAIFELREASTMAIEVTFVADGTCLFHFNTKRFRWAGVPPRKFASSTSDASSAVR